MQKHKKGLKTPSFILSPEKKTRITVVDPEGRKILRSSFVPKSPAKIGDKYRRKGGNKDMLKNGNLHRISDTGDFF